MKKPSIYLSLSLLVLIIQPLTAQNLISPVSWTIGSGSVGIFTQNGATSENIREWGEDPKGKRAILWKAVPDATSGPDGGWNTSDFNIDHTKMYRFSVWIKKTNSTNGFTYMGCRTQPDPVLNLSGSSNTNPYFWAGNLPQLDKWYLIVGYIHASNDNSITHYGGIYDETTGEKVISIDDFKFPVTATTAQHRSYLYYDTNTSDRQYFYGPRVDMINGDESSIENLLGIDIKTFIANNAQTTPRLGINTTNTGNFELAVNGEVKAKEVKVETGWSDFVFEADYKLPTLEEVEAFINENGHLPAIPSSDEVEKNGVNLGQMDSKLLQKIEELTLYLLQLKKENDMLKSRLERMEQIYKE
jgi:hypothetical protein